jgi:hypothetical protein
MMADSPTISHGCWDEGSGGYSEFLMWRALLARAAGIGTEMAELGEFTREIPKLDYDELNEDNIQGLWDEIPNDILVVLLAHSDEEGIITYFCAGLIADRLEELLPALSIASHHAPGSVLQHAERERTVRFIAGLRKAADNHEPVNFT